MKMIRDREWMYRPEYLLPALILLCVIGCVAAHAGASPDEVAQTVADSPPEGFAAFCLYWLGKIVGPLVEAITSKLAVASYAACAAGAVLSVLLTEWLKRFAPLLTWLFDGQYAVLKMRLASALVGGVIAVMLGPSGLKAGVIDFIAAAAASPTLYDLAYKLWPGFTDRMLSKVRGEPAAPPPPGG